jgi:predicted transposase YdaD
VDNEKRSAFPPQFEGNAYVALFRYERMLKDFVSAFVEIGPLRDTLDFERAELLERTFITEELREGERDIVWKVPGAGGEVFIVFLIEHQSTVDYAMPLRLLFYLTSLWHDHWNATPRAERESKEFRVPPVLPIVFYTGESPWTGAIRLFDKIACGEELRHFMPDFRFHLVDLCRFGEEELAGEKNLAKAVARVTMAFVRQLPGEQFTKIMTRIDPWGPREVELVGHILYNWAQARGRQDVAEAIATFVRSKEGRMASSEIMGKKFRDVWSEEAKAEGEARGLAEGEARGLAVGQAEKEAVDLREQLHAIRRYFERKGLDWAAYEHDIAGFERHRDATDFLVDLATAADPAAFLREKFGH